MGRPQAGGAYRAPSPFTPTLATSASADDRRFVKEQRRCFAEAVTIRENALVWWHVGPGLDMSTKRRGLYITYTPTRAADGSDGERTAWDAMHRDGKGVTLRLNCRLIS